MKLKQKIDLYLKGHNLKIYQLARNIGISQSILYDFLADKRDIRLSIAEKIEKYIEESGNGLA